MRQRVRKSFPIALSVAETAEAIGVRSEFGRRAQVIRVRVRSIDHSGARPCRR
jgi:hypothetical protein